MTRDQLIARLHYYACEDAEQGNVLTDAIAMLQRDGETIEELRDYAYHSPGCSTNRFCKVGRMGQMLRGDCSCGLDELLAALKESE